VFIRGRGWLRVDPTVLSVPRRLEGGLERAVAVGGALPLLMRPELAWLRTLRYNWEALTHQWNLWVLGYNPERQREFMSWLGMRDADWLELASTLLAALGGFVLVLFAWMLRRLARPDPVQAAWNAFCRKLGKRGLARAPHEGPQDFSARAARNFPSLDEPIKRIAALYIALRYGRGQSATELVELRRMVRELRFG